MPIIFDLPALSKRLLHTVPFVCVQGWPTDGARAKFGAFGDVQWRIASL